MSFCPLEKNKRSNGGKKSSEELEESIKKMSFKKKDLEIVKGLLAEDERGNHTKTRLRGW